MKFFKVLIITIFILIFLEMLFYYNNKNNNIFYQNNLSISNSQKNSNTSNNSTNLNTSITLNLTHEDDLIFKIKDLSDLANEYIKSSKTNYSALELCLQFIRKDSYNSSDWTSAAGKIDYDFVSYIEKNNKTLCDFDFKSSQILDTQTNCNIDLSHLCATLNAIIYTSIVPSDFSGWAGDLTTLMGEVINYDENKTTEELISYATNKLGNTQNSSFNLSDMLADVDAILISQLDFKNLYELIGYYYYSDNDIILNRFTNFKKSLGNNVYQTVTNRFTGIIDKSIVMQILNQDQAKIYYNNPDKYINIMAKAFDNYFQNY